MHQLFNALWIEGPPAGTSFDQCPAAFQELVDNLVKLTAPCEPDDLMEIARKTAYRPRIIEAADMKVMPPAVSLEDAHIQRIEAILSEIRAALAEMRDLACKVHKRRRAERRQRR
ncbi:hypothetical protein HY633_05285 [Candidatus Uhrbacteria bacterium]|nr:hypothetical protein [Candidatus Uhrbacteria bacterium]